MRYRRLLEPLRQQNWTAVGIKLVIVFERVPQEGRAAKYRQ